MTETDALPSALASTERKDERPGSTSKAGLTLRFGVACGRGFGFDAV